MSEFTDNIERIARENDERIPLFPIRECHEKLVSLRTTPHLLFDDKGNDYLIREGVFERIVKALKLLKEKNLSLYICDTYRPLSVQKKYWDADVKSMKLKYPEITDNDEIARMVAKFTAPIERAQHCTGGSIDVLLYDLQKNTIIDDFDESDVSLYDELLYTDNPNITSSEKEHRALLKSTLETVGFVNYPLEWWHYSYGNAEWAIYSGKKFAIYGPIEDG